MVARIVQIVLVHGLGVSHRYWARLRRVLPAAAPDLRGDSVEEMAASLVAVLTGPSLLVANSLGCQVAAEVAARRPELVEGMVLIGPTWDPSAPTATQQAIRLWHAAFREEPSLLPLLAWEYVHWSPLRFTRVVRSMLRHPVADRLAEASAPVVVVRGEHDPICGPAWARLAAGVGRGDFVEIRGAAHAAHWSHPEAVQKTVDDLVERIGGLEHRHVPRTGDQLEPRTGDRL